MVKRTKYFLLLFSLILLFSSRAQKPVNKPLPNAKPSAAKAVSDTLTAAKDTANQKKSSKNALDAVVQYQAKDSMVFLGNNRAQMYGEGKVDYKDIELKADYIQMTMDSSIVYATGRKDTADKMIGEPVFKDKGGEYNSKTMRYNFKTKRGYITQVVTEQGEGYVIGGKTKKMETDDLYMTDCKYTTCEDHDHPHFYFNLTKAKVRPKKNIVTGPAYLVLEDVPLPLAIPFGFFPFSSKYSSGVLVPTYGDELNRGFYLRDGGYYFAINDYVDLALRGEIFTKGSWGLSGVSSYVKKYKYSGSFNFGYRTTILGEKNAPDYSKSKDFNITWSHSQDAKASATTTFSASVNFATSTYDRRDIGGVYDASRFTNNNKSSSVNITKRFPNSPFSLSASMSINQRSSDSSVNVSLPDLNIAMSRIYPFKRKNAIGKECWYEKIGMSYSGSIRNNIDTKEDKLFHSNLIKDWRNGMQHSIPVSATFNVLKYISVTPSFNYAESWFTNKVDKSWDAVNQVEKTDTTWGFNRMYRYSASVGVSTKLYGFYQPLPIFGKKIEMIRHVFTPTLSFNYSPNFQDEKFGFWRSYNYVSSGKTVVKYYSPYETGLYYSAPGTKSGSVQFNMTHNLEMKIKSDRDTSGVRKISLIDNFTTGISYNMAADSMRWSDIGASIRIKLTKGFTLNLSGTFDPYTYKLSPDGKSPVRVNTLRWEKYRTIGRLQSTGTSFSYTLNNEVFNKLFGKDDKAKDKKNASSAAATATDPNNPDELNPDQTQDKKSDKTESKGTFDSDGYMVWNVPWSLSFNYSMRYGYADFNKELLEYNRKITHSLGFSGSLTLTKAWSFNMSSTYDFDAHKIAYTNINISRDLHCWQMSGGVVPFGPYKSFNVSISVKSALLKDFKYDKRGSSYNGVPWY